MDKSLTIWTRLGNWLRTGSGPDATQDRQAAGLDKGLMTGVLAKPVSEKPSRGGALSGWSRRDHTLQQIQEGNERLMEVLGAVKSYMDKQEKRSDQMAESLGAVADTFSKLPELTENQTAVLTNIAAAMEQSKNHTQELALTMRETPDAIRAQGDALRRFQETLESSPLHDGRMVGSLEEIRGSMSTMTHTADSQVHLLREIRETDERRADALEVMINNQSKLQTKLIALMITVVVLLIVGGIAAAMAWTAGGG